MMKLALASSLAVVTLAAAVRKLASVPGGREVEKVTVTESRRAMLEVRV